MSGSSVQSGLSARLAQGAPWRIAALLGAAALALFGLLMPEAWLRPAASNQAPAAAPFGGLILTRACFILESVAVAAAALLLRVGGAAAPAPIALVSAPLDGDVSRLSARRAVLALVVVAAALRLGGLNSPLWLDEISPILDYGHLSWNQVLATYAGSNNHLLNTLLVNATISVFGPEAWAARLPAALFGIASVPALYALARMALGRAGSLSAAALLTLSYHHVFFSQSARGYSAYLFFGLLASILFLRALRTERIRDWGGYAAAAVLAMLSLLNGAFIVAAHFLVTAALAMRRSGTGLPAASLRRSGAAFGAVGLLVIHAYAPVLPQIHAVMTTVYATGSAGFPSPLSAEFLRDLLTGQPPQIVAAALVLAPLIALIMAVGLSRIGRASPVLAWILLLPNALLAAFVLAERLAVTPRLFLFALVPAFILAAAGLERMAQFGRRPGAGAGHARLAVASAALALIFGAGLPRYYAVPKQDYPAAVRFIAENRRPGDIVIVSHLTEYGYRHHAGRLGVPLDPSTYFIRDPGRFAATLARHPGRTVWIVSTFERALRIELPAIDAALRSRWTLVRRFPGTIGDGDLLVYRRPS